MKVKLRKKWNDSENNVLELFIVLLPVILSLPKGLHFEVLCQCWRICQLIG